MSIEGKIGYSSDIAAGATRDAAALSRLLVVMRQVGAAQGSGGGGSKAPAGGVSANQAAAIQARASAQVIAIQAKQGLQSQQLAAKATAQRNAIEARGAAQSQATAARAAAQGQALAAKDAAQKNAAIAKIVQIQAKGAQQTAQAEARGEEQRKAIAAKGAADLEKIAAQHAAKMAELDAKRLAQVEKEARTEARAKEKPAANGPSGKGGGAGGAGAGGLEGASAQLAILQRVLSVYASIAQGMVGLVEKGAEMAISATTFKEQMVGAFEVMHRSAGQSEALYQKAMDLAVKTGRDPAIIAGEFNRLAQAKFKDSQIPAIAKMLADVKAIGGEKGEARAGAIEKLLEKTQAKGSLDKGGIQALVKQGVSQKELYEQLAKVLHKPVADIPGLVKTGKIDAAHAIEAITKVVQKGVGGMANKLADEVPTLLARIKIALTTLFVLPKGALDPIKNALKTILGLITGPEGKALKKGITDLFGNLFKLLGGVGKDSGAIKGVFAAITGVIKTVAAVIAKITPGVRGFVKGFKEGFGDAIPMIRAALVPLQQMAKWFGLIGGAASGWKLIGKAIGLVFGIIATGAVVVGTFVGVFVTAAVSIAFTIGVIAGVIATGIGKVIGWFVKLASKVKGAISSAVASVTSARAKMRTAGTNLIGGLTTGITAGLSRAVAAAGKVAAAVIARVKAILGIASDSKVFTAIGGYTVSGFTNSVNRNAPRAVAAAGNMAKGASAAAQKASAGGFGPASGGSKGGKGGSGPSVTFQINVAAGAAAGAGGDDALAKKIGTVVDDRIDAWWRRQAA